LLAVPIAVAETSTPLFVSIDGPIVMGKGETIQYRIEAIGGPAEGTSGNYSFRTSILGTDMTDAYVLPTNGESEDGVFFVNVTAKGTIPNIVLWVNVTSSYGGEAVSKIKEYGITVVDPVVIRAEIENQGSVAVNDVPLTIYADGKVIHETTVSLDPQEITTLVYNWTELDIAMGEHVITMILDPDHEFITFRGGGTVHTSTIWVGEQDFGGWDLILGILVVFLAFIAYTFYRRPSKRHKKR